MAGSSVHDCVGLQQLESLIADDLHPPDDRITYLSARIRCKECHMPFDYEKVKNILVCPKCRTALVHEGDALVCVNAEACCRYPIVDDIPRLLADEAGSVERKEWTEIMSRHGRDAESGGVE